MREMKVETVAEKNLRINKNDLEMIQTNLKMKSLKRNHNQKKKKMVRNSEKLQVRDQDKLMFDLAYYIIEFNLITLSLSI